MNFSGIDVLWDNDATLVDSEIIAMPHAVDSVMAELARQGFASRISQSERDALVVNWAGTQISEMFIAMEKRFGFTLSDDYRQELCQDDANRVIEALKFVEMIDGVDNVLSLIQSSGGRNSVVTSSSLLRVVPGLEHNGMIDYFRDSNSEQPRIFSATETLINDPAYGRAIPKGINSPEIYEYVLRNVCSGNSDVVAIEDSRSGVGSAIRAGIPVVGLVAASHIQDVNKHAEDLKQTIVTVLESISNAKTVRQSDIDRRIKIVFDAKDIPLAIGQLVGRDNINQDFAV